MRAGWLGLVGKYTLVDADVADVAEVVLDDVVQFDAVGRPREVRQFRLCGLRGVVEGPSEHAADVVAVVVLAGGFGLISECPLIDADVAMITEMSLYDVVEVDTGGRPLAATVIFVGAGCWDGRNGQNAVDDGRGDEPSELQRTYHPVPKAQR